ncbi:MAG: sodium:calcium antiporter [Thioalkalivibrio sp.]|nr:sodium:calcium antiporter [Thioalkalivibrio sp.]
MALSLTVSLAGFLLAAAVIGVCGVLITARAEYLARVTGLGQVVMGAVFIGATTSLSGLVTSGTAAIQGHASLAVSNSLGGIAAQTVFLAVADMVYRRANLEHAAASEANLQQVALLIALLAIPLFAMATPQLEIGWMHPASIVLVITYVGGVKLVSRAHQHPMWRPRITQQTPPEGGEGRRGERAVALDWLVFAALAAAVAASGWVIATSGIALSSHLGIQESVVGGVFTAVSTSLPELVIAVAAVRRGALALAVGDVIGGNSFDVLFLSVSDALYREGSLYASLGTDELLWIAVTILMSGTLMMGLLRREKFGFGNIGFESTLVLGLYAITLATLFLR